VFNLLCACHGGSIFASKVSVYMRLFMFVCVVCLNDTHINVRVLPWRVDRTCFFPRLWDICVNIYTYVYTCACGCVYVCVCVCVCMCVSVFVSIHVCTYAYIYIHSCLCINVYKYMHVYTYICIYRYM